MGRKFSYLRRLKMVLALLRTNVAQHKDKRRKTIQSNYHYKKTMLARFFAVLKDEDVTGKTRE